MSIEDAREQDRHRSAYISSVAKAHSEGEAIQVRPKGGKDDWETIDENIESPSWDWDAFDFRVKPEERKPIVVKFWIHPDYPTTFRHEGFFPTVSFGESEGWTLTTFREVLPETETE